MAKKRRIDGHFEDLREGFGGRWWATRWVGDIEYAANGATPEEAQARAEQVRCLHLSVDGSMCCAFGRHVADLPEEAPDE